MPQTFMEKLPIDCRRRIRKYWKINPSTGKKAMPGLWVAYLLGRERIILLITRSCSYINIALEFKPKSLESNPVKKNQVA